MSFWGSLFGGQNKTLTADMGKTGQIADFSSGMGQSDLTAGDSYFKSLVSGDATKTATALAPQISSLKTAVNQDQKTSSQNGNRSGGTAAGNAAAKDKAHAEVTNLTGNLTSGAASTLLSSGSSLLSTATNGYGQQVSMSQEQMENWSKSILGKGITGGAAAAESFGLGAAGGAIAGTGAGAGGMSALMAG